LLLFGVLAILSIGGPFFLLGVLLLGVLLGRRPRWPHSLGLLSGAGTVCLLIATIGAVPGPARWAMTGLTTAAIGGAAGSTAT